MMTVSVFKGISDVTIAYRIKSACLVRCPNLWVINIAVLCPRCSRILEKRLYSASGSRAEVGSSAIRRRISPPPRRKNVRALKKIRRSLSK